jgi:hypothetical protein
MLLKDAEHSLTVFLAIKMQDQSLSRLLQELSRERRGSGAQGTGAGRQERWLLRVGAAGLTSGGGGRDRVSRAWYVAGHLDRWTGTARYESTDDTYMSGDVTPLSAKVSGYVEKVAVGDYQSAEHRQGTVALSCHLSRHPRESRNASASAGR